MVYGVLIENGIVGVIGLIEDTDEGKTFKVDEYIE
jgi:hypothetical protein